MGRSGTATAAKRRAQPVRRTVPVPPRTATQPTPAEQFEHALYRLLSDERSGRLAWTNGHCFTLALGLKERFGRRATLRTLIGANGAEHVLVQIGQVFADGDGVSTRKQLLDRWRAEYGTKSPRLVPFNWMREAKQLNAPDEARVDAICALARELMPDELVRSVTGK